MSAPTCPICGAPAVRIVYGFPGPRMVEALREGAIDGGCVIKPERWACRGPIQHRWAEPGGEPADPASRPTSA